MADACLFLMEHHDGPEQVNVGTGVDQTIRESAEIVAEVVGFKGETLWDTSKPDGTPRKLLDVSNIGKLGWRHQYSFSEGLLNTYEWYESSRS